MKRAHTVIVTGLFILNGIHSSSYADDLPPIVVEPMLGLASGQDECRLLISGTGNSFQDGPACDVVDAQSVDGLGTLTLRAGKTKSPDGWTFTLSIRPADNITRISRPIAFSGSGGMGEYLSVRQVTPTMKSSTIGTRLAAVIDFEVEIEHAQRANWDNEEEGPVVDATYRHHTFVICGTSAVGAWYCATFQVGELGDPCRASLSDSGVLSVLCDGDNHARTYPIDMDRLAVIAQEREKREKLAAEALAQAREKREKLAAQAKIEQSRNERGILNAVPANGNKCKSEIQRWITLSHDINRAALTGNSALAETKAKQRDGAANRICGAARALRAAIRIYESKSLGDAANAIANEHRECLAACQQ